MVTFKHLHAGKPVWYVQDSFKKNEDESCAWIGYIPYMAHTYDYVVKVSMGGKLIDSIGGGCPSRFFMTEKECQEECDSRNERMKT
jgi:hypothetical protein